jgi:hypothetical protein
MVKGELDFEAWFDILSVMVLDKCGVNFRDKESVRNDYEAGKNCADVADAIAAEYAD